MSNVSNRHSILPFNAGKSAALSGQRLIRVLYKPSKHKKPEYKSVCVSVPKLSQPFSPEVLQKLNPYIVELVENTQQNIVKSLYESSQGALTSVSDDDISIDAVIGYLEAESNGGRLTKEILSKWFVENMADNLYVVLCEKLEFQDPNKEQEELVQQQLNGYKEMISALSGGATVYQEKQVKALKRAIEVSSVDDDISKKLNARLDGMLKPNKVLDNLMEL
jgi:hypothetical protein